MPNDGPQLLDAITVLFLLCVICYGIWDWRLRRVAERYEALKVELGGKHFRGVSWNTLVISGRRGAPPALTSPIAPIVFVGMFGFMMSMGSSRFDPAGAGIALLLAAAFFAVWGVYVFVCRWTDYRGVRPHLYRAVFTRGEAAQRPLIFAALAQDPEVGAKVREDLRIQTPPGASPTRSPVPSAPAGESPAEGVPRFSDAPPPF